MNHVFKSIRNPDEGLEIGTDINLRRAPRKTVTFILKRS